MLQSDGLMVMHEQSGPLPVAMRPVMRQAPYLAPSLPQLIRYVEDAGLRMLTWRDTTDIVVDYFLNMRNLVLSHLNRAIRGARPAYRSSTAISKRSRISADAPAYSSHGVRDS